VSVAIDVDIRSEKWRRSLPRARAIARRAVNAALEEAAHRGDAEVGVVLTDDKSVAALNRKYRGKSGATDVLSFAARPPLLGDVVIAYERAARDARAEKKPLAHHLAHLCVHGTLHLLGHDHVKAGDARRMESLEVAALFRLGIADPYNGRAR
jgi:probable rRNA maturation factor